MTSDEKSPALENDPADPNFFIRGVRLGFGGLESEYPLRDANGLTYEQWAKIRAEKEENRSACR
jgi:hypothetical protein